MPDEPYKCELCGQNTAEILALDTRVTAVEQTTIRLREGFLKNDLGLPDYDGHRTAHRMMVEQSNVVDSYKQSTTKSILSAAAFGALGMFVMGAIEWIKAHVR